MTLQSFLFLVFYLNFGLSKMESLFVVLVMFVVAASVPYLCATITPDTAPCFNVLHFGATGNGQTDDSQVCFPLLSLLLPFIYFSFSMMNVAKFHIKQKYSQITYV